MAFEIEQPVDAGPSPVVEPTKPRLLGVLGPGLITGASDDDPSGIATYSQAGAQFGYALTWTMLFTYPLMTAVQIVSARMGRTTGRGIAGNLRQHCPPWLLTGIVVLLLIANAINIGADLGAMADASRLVVGGPQIFFVLLFAAICIALQIFLQYTRYVAVLKWLTLFLFAYVACMFMVKVPWSEAAKSLVIPSLRWEKDYLTTVVAVLGTTISPYLFFWQASQEAEDVRTVPARQILKRAPHQGEKALNRIHPRHLRRNGAFELHRPCDHDHGGCYAARQQRHRHPDLGPGSRSLAAHCRASCRDDICPWRHRHRHVCPSPSSPDRRHTPSAKRGSGRPGSPASRWKPRPSTQSFASRRSSA